MSGLGPIEEKILLLQALGASGKVSHHEMPRNQWLSKHLDRTFDMQPYGSDLPSIMGVASSKGPQYIAQVYGDLLRT